MDPLWDAPQEAQEPTEEGYYLALERGLAADTQQETYLRVLAWWRRNDAFRDESSAQEPGIATFSDSCRKNLEALVALIDDADEGQRLTKAELLRELGEFEAAKETLRTVTSDQYTVVARQILSLCERKDACVRRVDLDA